MKILITILLASFLMTVFVPVQINIQSDFDRKDVSLLTLDVCNASGSALSAHADLTFVCEGPCKLTACDAIRRYDFSNHVFTPFLVSFQQERPPKA